MYSLGLPGSWATLKLSGLKQHHWLLFTILWAICTVPIQLMWWISEIGRRLLWGWVTLLTYPEIERLVCWGGFYWDGLSQFRMPSHHQAQVSSGDLIMVFSGHPRATREGKLQYASTLDFLLGSYLPFSLAKASYIHGHTWTQPDRYHPRMWL